MKVENRVLVILIFIALVFSLSGTFITLNVLNLRQVDFLTGLATGEANVSVNATTTITMLNDTVDFATLNPPEAGSNFTDDTTDNDPNPFTIRNDGTVPINITVWGTAIWQTEPSITWNFTAACGNTSEHKCYGCDGSNPCAAGNETFFRVPITSGTAVAVVTDLNQSAALDVVEVEINVSVPRDEGTGARGSTLTFTAASAS